jgi:hypothetical protein
MIEVLVEAASTPEVNWSLRLRNVCLTASAQLDNFAHDNAIAAVGRIIRHRFNPAPQKPKSKFTNKVRTAFAPGRSERKANVAVLRCRSSCLPSSS